MAIAISILLVSSYPVLLFGFIKNKVGVISSPIFFIGAGIFCVPLVLFFLDALHVITFTDGNMSLKFLMIGIVICVAGGCLSTLEFLTKKLHVKHPVLFGGQLLWTIGSVVDLLQISAFI